MKIKAIIQIVIVLAGTAFSGSLWIYDFDILLFMKLMVSVALFVAGIFGAIEFGKNFKEE